MSRTIVVYKRLKRGMMVKILSFLFRLIKQLLKVVFVQLEQWNDVLKERFYMRSRMLFDAVNTPVGHRKKTGLSKRNKSQLKSGKGHYANTWKK